MAGFMGFEAILNGDLQEGIKICAGTGERHQINGQNYFFSYINENNKLSAAATRQFCEMHPVRKKHIEQLLALQNGSVVEEEYLARFECLGLASEDGNLTAAGYFKLIEGLPLKEQVRLLKCKFLVSEFDGAIPTIKTEHYITKKYENLGCWCRHDESGTIQHLIIFSLLSDVAHLKELLSSQPHVHENKFFEIAFNLHSFRSDIKNGEIQFSHNERAALISILRDMTPDKIRLGYERWEKVSNEARQFAHVPSADLEPALRLFEALGVDRLVNLAIFRMDHHNEVWGWPDILLINGGDIDLIEVKKNDKLSYKQIRTFDALGQHTRGIFRSISVERVVLR